jgi:hypothetical protein
LGSQLLNRESEWAIAKKIRSERGDTRISSIRKNIGINVNAKKGK